MKEKTKLLKVSLPLNLWERFYLLYPGSRQRANFLRLVIETVVEQKFSLDVLGKEGISNLLGQIPQSGKESSCIE